jgi:hypothetical protein
MATYPLKKKELKPAQKAVFAPLGVIQFVLLVAALADIRRRPADKIKGSKRFWTAVAFVNFVGPIAYFLFGRKP